MQPAAGASKLATSPNMLKIATLAAVLAGAAACGRPEQAVILSGSTSLQPLAEKWAERYQARHGELSIAVQGGGSTAGVQAALSGAAQIGLSSRALTQMELSHVRATTVARDGIALVVHPSNPLNDLSPDAIRNIYSGQTSDWQRLGGRAKPITVITREEGSGTRSAFEDLVMNKRPITASALVQDSTGAVRQMVSSDPAAIGYISIGLVDGSVKALRLNGVAATEASIDSGAYPLVRPFLFVLRGQPDAQTQRFITWVSSPEGRELARREGMLPPREVSLDAHR
jgi:phosphate transport system substrate-binding protein